MYKANINTSLMNTKDIKQILLSGVILLVLDFLFLSANSKAFGEEIAAVQRVALQLQPVGIITCYLFIISGLYYFILREHRSPLDAFLLGIVIYGIYESTNYATFKKWNPTLAVMDTLWGGVLYSTTTYFTYLLSG